MHSPVYRHQTKEDTGTPRLSVNFTRDVVESRPPNEPVPELSWELRLCFGCLTSGLVGSVVGANESCHACHFWVWGFCCFTSSALVLGSGLSRTASLFDFVTVRTSVTLGKLANPTEPRFLPLEKGNNSTEKEDNCEGHIRLECERLQVHSRTWGRWLSVKCLRGSCRRCSSREQIPVDSTVMESDTDGHGTNKDEQRDPEAELPGTIFLSASERHVCSGRDGNTYGLTEGTRQQCTLADWTPSAVHGSQHPMLRFSAFQGCFPEIKRRTPCLQHLLL
jgi:hypothetical protein